MGLPLGAHIYIVGNHPWADCAGVIVAYEYNEALDRFGARVHLDDENIDVMVWRRCQLRTIPEE